MSHIVEKSFKLAQSASGARDPIDLKERMQLTGLIREMVLTVQGNQVSTAGGAITGFGREAPLNLLSLITLSGKYIPTGQIRTVISAPGDEMYWPASFLNGQPGTILITSSGASATDPIRGVINDFIKDPSQIYEDATYIDTRLYTSLDFVIQWLLDASYATTNLSDLTALELEIAIKEEVNPDFGPDAPHFEPSIVSKDHGTVSQNTKVDNDALVNFDGLVNVIFFRQHDESAAGNLERVNGLIRRMTVKHGARAVIDNHDWQSVLRKTQNKFALALTTTQPDGVAALIMDPPLNSRSGNLTVLRDTQTASPPGITDVTPAAGDKLVTTILVAEPNAAMDAELVAAGVS